jgi:hypothetical protein
VLEEVSKVESRKAKGKTRERFGGSEELGAGRWEIGGRKG